MFTLLAIPTAFAVEGPDDEAVRLLVSKSFGKDVPAKYLCVERPTLPEAFTEPVVVAGVKVKGKGCVAKGILVRGRIATNREALPLALDSWSSLSLSDREDIAAAWTRQVLFAFQHPMALPETEQAGSNIIASALVVNRTGVPLVGEQTNQVWTFDAKGIAVEEFQDTSHWQSSLVLKSNSSKGIETQDVQTSIESVGKYFETCFRAAWQQDLTMVERTRLSWDIVKNKATDIKVRQQSNGKLSQCYANALSRVEFPVDGSADFDFGVRRVKVQLEAE